MFTVNYPTNVAGQVQTSYTVEALGADFRADQHSLVDRILTLQLPRTDFPFLSQHVRHLGVTQRFEDVITTFGTTAGHTPAGFRIDSQLRADGLLEFDLVRDISYDTDGVPRPTGLVFSADSANPYEVEPIAPLLGNLTCNPGIVYDLFINNPRANVDHRFSTREEVIGELGRILGPGCDVSVELNNPFEKDFERILDEAAEFRDLLNPYRVVIKVPHTGPVNAENVEQLLEGDGRLDVRYDSPAIVDALRGHNLALRLREHGYRVNFTLMFEPWQTALALQAKPAFINSFIRHRAKQSATLQQLIEFFESTDDPRYLVEIRQELLSSDHLAGQETDRPLLECLKLAKDIVRYRRFSDDFGSDGLDGVRRNLQWLRHANLSDTRLILCSMEGEYNYPDIDNLLSDPEFEDVIDRVVLTAEPSYLARFTSASQVVSYQRRFMRAAASAR